MLPFYCFVEGRGFVHPLQCCLFPSDSLCDVQVCWSADREESGASSSTCWSRYLLWDTSNKVGLVWNVCLLVRVLFICLFLHWLLMWTSFSGQHHCTLPVSCSKNPPWRIVGRKEKCLILGTSCSWTPSLVSRLSSSNPHVLFPWLTSKSGSTKRMPLFFAWSGC